MGNLALRNSSGLGLIDDFFSDFFNDRWNLKRNIDSYQDPAHYFFDEKTKEYVITVQAPGFSKKEINIEVDAGGISIEGELQDEELKRRIGNKSFSYKMRKPGIDENSINANLENGILEVRFKPSDKKDLKKIEIK
jgi:HSP20 family molecular chaperone IbpA